MLCLVLVVIVKLDVVGKCRNFFRLLWFFGLEVKDLQASTVEDNLLRLEQPGLALVSEANYCVLTPWFLTFRLQLDAQDLTIGRDELLQLKLRRREGNASDE